MNPKALENKEIKTKMKLKNKAINWQMPFRR